MLQVIRFFIGILLLNILAGCNRQSATSSGSVSDVALLHQLNERLTNVIMQDAFTPPVAARIYAYSNVAAYESSILFDKNYRSMTGQLKELTVLPTAPDSSTVDKRIILLRTFAMVANSILYRDSILQNFSDSLIKILELNETIKKKERASFQYADSLGKAIIEWSKADGYGRTRKMAIYTPLQKPESWQPTPPKYADAIEPYWGSLRPFVLDSAGMFFSPFTIRFDTVPGSAFYQMCKAEYDTATRLDSVRKMIARFWDDNPLIILSKGHTMLNYRQISPPGHWVNITKIVAKQKQLSLQQSADIYMRVSLSLADAIIACWHTKYTNSTIRPVTYINQYIDPAWKPLIETPPFPEYTCGHSTLSAAASQTLATFFGDTVEFIDDTNDPYDLPIRKFNSFLKASEEAGISRMYGGIHFHPSCEAGRAQGLKTAALITRRLVTVKVGNEVSF
jgi:hypothetical protein